MNETPGEVVHENPYSEEEPESKDEEPVIKDNEPVSEDDEPVIEDMPERPVRQRRRPDRYGEWVTLTRTSTEPTSVKEVMKSPNKEKWEEFGVLCCLTTPGLRKDIRRQIRQLYSHKVTYYVHYNYILSSHLLSHSRFYFYC